MDRMIDKKVREAQVAQFNYILVVGEKEIETRQVSVRVRDQRDSNSMTVDGLIEFFKEEAAAFH